MGVVIFEEGNSQNGGVAQVRLLEKTPAGYTSVYPRVSSGDVANYASLFFRKGTPPVLDERLPTLSELFQRSIDRQDIFTDWAHPFWTWTVLAYLAISGILLSAIS